MKKILIVFLILMITGAVFASYNSVEAVPLEISTTQEDDTSDLNNIDFNSLNLVKRCYDLYAGGAGGIAGGSGGGLAGGGADIKVAQY